MQFRYAAIAAASFAGVSAQEAYGGAAAVSSSTSSAVAVSSPMTASASQSYVTVTHDDCPSSSIATMITVTGNVTVTYCPECSMAAAASSTPTVPHTTVYTTVYQSLCPTGLVPATYTITEICTDATPSWATHSTDIPPGFTATVKSCTVCNAELTPVPVTITEPCGCEAASGVSAPQTTPAATTTAPATAPAGTASQPSQAGGIVSQISDGKHLHTHSNSHQSLTLHFL
jgi:hypothetical protein